MRQRGSSIWNKMHLGGMVVFIAIYFSACTKESTSETSNLKIENLKIDPGFDYNTTQIYNVSINVKDNQGETMQGVPVKIYAQRDSLIPGQDSLLIYTGFSDENGVVQTSLTLPSSYKSILLRPDYLGLVDEVEVPLNQTNVSYTLGGLVTEATSFSTLKSLKAVAAYTFLGGWNNQGVPDYLTADRFVADQTLLASLNYTLPQGQNLSTTYPAFLAHDNGNLVLNAAADVWVSLLSEGASKSNSLGYYTYTQGAAPQSASEIASLKIIFPNATIGGGKLLSGNKVFLGNFPAGTVIGWFIVYDGWQKKTVSETQPIYYSNPQFNPEINSEKKKHFVPVYDDAVGFYGIGFEELNRELSYCDHDFNDLVFNAIVVPFSAASLANSNHLLTSVDSDGDGIINTLDQYPTDPLRAYNNYYPSSGTMGSLVFEDLWPATGDYDFNDLVVDYQYNMVTNANNQVVDIKIKSVVRAIGASFHNGLGISLNTLPSAVASVTGNSLKNSYISVAANGTENGQDKATIILFDDAFDLLQRPGFGTGVNTEQGAPYMAPDTLRVTIALTTPANLADLGALPYNPFMIRNKERGYEIHLPDNPPTKLANLSLYGTDQDTSDPATGRYYKTATNLPWALNIPVSFSYPFEKISILRAYPRFGEWAESGGTLFPDWYQNLAGYRDPLYIYTKP